MRRNVLVSISVAAGMAVGVCISEWIHRGEAVQTSYYRGLYQLAEDHLKGLDSDEFTKFRERARNAEFREGVAGVEPYAKRVHESLIKDGIIEPDVFDKINMRTKAAKLSGAIKSD
jgi:hypothetical protein